MSFLFFPNVFSRHELIVRFHSDGELVADGTDFRNTAHLRYKADILVPCGGRPESVNVTNVNKLWDAEGVPNFKYIVEG